MITYEYKCTSCDHHWEEKQKISDPKTTTCPECEQETAQRLISTGNGFVLKGSGWFNTGGY
jgi:putative FmdB family regulatory protein